MLQPDIVTSPPYNEMRRMYSKLFSLGYLNTDINTKFALISLICYVTYKAKMKKSDVTHYQILMNNAFVINDDICYRSQDAYITKDKPLPEDYIKGLAVVCEDFSYGCTTFPTFNIKPSEIVKTIQDILSKSLPF